MGMEYIKSYLEEKEISTSKLNKAQKTLYYIAENMKMDKSISEEGYKHFQMAIKALDKKPYEKFESVKDHIYKMAGDYKCWDNRLTEDEAVELCHILEQQQPSEDVISRQAVIDVIEREQFKGDAISEIEKLPPVTPQPMKEKWQELKETIIEMRDNDGTCTQQEVCKFLANLMDVLEKQVENKENEKEI